MRAWHTVPDMGGGGFVNTVSIAPHSGTIVKAYRTAIADLGYKNTACKNK